jgi:hypothetical protein
LAIENRARLSRLRAKIAALSRTRAGIAAAGRLGAPLYGGVRV